MDVPLVNSTPALAPDLARDYGLRINVLRQHPGGFESDCLAADGTWFIKVWRRSEAPARLGLRAQVSATPAVSARVTATRRACSGGRPGLGAGAGRQHEPAVVLGRRRMS